MAHPAAEPLDLVTMKARTADRPATPAAELTPAEVPVSVEWRDPETGALRRYEGTSKVPIDKAHLERMVAAQCQGLAWATFHPRALLRFEMCARIALQLVDFDKAPAWLGRALATDDAEYAEDGTLVRPALCMELGAALTEHERTYFRGDASARGAASAAPRVALLAPRATRPGGAGG